VPGYGGRSVKETRKEHIVAFIALSIVLGIFTVTVYATQNRSETGVWVIQPFFAYNLTRGEGGPNHTVEGQQVLRILPVGDGRRFHLFLNVDYSLVSDDPYPIENTSRYVIEGTRMYTHSTRDLEVWIKVDRMYDYALCLDENGYLDQLPYKGELPQ